MKRRADTLVSAREAGRWLSTLTRDSETACEAVASALTDAERFGPFSAERHQAVLLVDKWASPLQEQLLTEYPLAGNERANRLASTLGRISRSFGRYYDELIEALRAVPRDGDYPHLSYVALVRRLAHVRYESVLHALGQGAAPNWHRTHRMYRIAVQERSRDGSRSADDNRAATLGTSAESEYIQILLTSRLAGAGFEPAEVLCAIGWLGHWVDSLAISLAPRNGNAFAIYPTGSEGLSAPPQALVTGLLWLDVAPLHLDIRREMSRMHDTAAEPDDDFGLSSARRIALLERLLDVWSGPRGNDARRDPRRPLHKPVQVAFGLTGISDAIRLSEKIARQLREAEARASRGRPTMFPLARWTVSDVSDSGCRIRGETQAVASLAIGTPAAIRVDTNDTWVLGIVRRRGALDGPYADLGIELIATRVKLLAIRERVEAASAPPAGDAHAGAATEPAPGWPALLLGPAPHSTLGQSVLVRVEDYGLGRAWFCDTRRHRYRLTLQHALERHAGCVWAALSVARIAQLAPVDAPVQQRGSAGRDDTIA